MLTDPFVTFSKQDSYSRVVEYYGENARSISPANFYAQIVRFVNAFKVSLSFQICSFLWSLVFYSQQACQMKDPQQQKKKKTHTKKKQLLQWEIFVEILPT